MPDPLTLALLSGGISFLSAKASGASTRNSLFAGIVGGGTSFGLGKLGGNLAVGAGKDAASNTLLQNLGKGFQGGTNIAIGSTVGTGVGVGSMPNPQQPKPTYSQGDYEDALARENLKPQDYEMGEVTRPAPDNLFQYGADPRGQFAYNKGGIVNAIPHYAEGGINYLPSKMEHDEKDSNNYVRAEGYVEDGTGVGDKDEDTMLAQLADGEFVSRADAILGAGIMAGADPKDMKEMRKKGATFFYNQQDQMKRIHDLVNAN
tara:strand:+ start:176 stop:958 length:783 start_codon:yes stop_codon:yes gene_type:complete